MDRSMLARNGMTAAGKFLELIALVIVAAGLLSGILNKNLIKAELAALAIGCLIFYVGYLLEKK